MAKHIRIDFVSDIACPWCVIGLRGLEQALADIGDDVVADIHFQPFELNPSMPREGQDIGEHVREKYGASPEQSAANRAAIRERAAGVGFSMPMSDGSRIYNTFDAHRLLHWAGLEGRQRELKHALFASYFTYGLNPAETDVLVDAAVAAGLDGRVAREVVETGRYTDEVRAEERQWQSKGISSVPATIVDGKYLISGGQPAAAFEKALREIAAAN